MERLEKMGERERTIRGRKGKCGDKERQETKKNDKKSRMIKRGKQTHVETERCGQWMSVLNHTLVGTLYIVVMA